MKKHLFKIAVKVLVTDRKGNVLLIKRGQNPHKGYWDAPGGKMEYGESVKEAGRREVKEETGLDVKITDFLGTAQVFSDIVLIYFHGKLKGGKSKIQKEEIEDMAWIPKSRLLKQKNLRPQLKEVLTK